jgi:hypothetical protein
MDEVMKAEQTLAALQAKRAAAEARAAEIAEARKVLGFKVHAAGDSKARAKLDKLNVESATHASELASLDAAIETAQRGIAEAEAAEARAGRRAAATALRAEIRYLRAAGQGFDNALEAVVAASDTLRGVLDKVHELGFSHPNHAQLLSMQERALKTMLMHTPAARAFEHLAPGERRNMRDAINAWAEMLENEAAKFDVDERQSKAPEAA